MIRSRRTRWPAHAWALAAALACVVPGGAARSPQPATRHPDHGLQILDGMSFHGTFGPKGGDERDEDTFTFDNGMFTSVGCVDYGFTPRPYWVREVDGVVHFLAEMESEEHGLIVYRGRILGDRIDATYVWTKERWYWNVRREFWFRGRLVTGR